MYKYLSKIIVTLLTIISFNLLADPVVIVNKSASITAISVDELANIYLKKAMSFPNGGDVNPLDMSGNEQLKNKFYTDILKLDTSYVSDYWTEMLFSGELLPLDEIDNAEAIINKVLSDKSYIGYIDSSKVDDRVVVITIQ